jgi:hypothetical protein
MNKVLSKRLRVAVRVLGATALVVALPVHAGKPPPSGGGGATTVSTTTSAAGDWTITRLQTPQQYPAVGYDVGFTADGLAQIGQIDAGARFVWQTASGSWQKQVVSSADIQNSLSFAVASDGRAAMAFSAGPKGELQYAERTASGTWSITTIESRDVQRSYGYIDLEFDQEGFPAIAYNAGSNPTLIKLARRIDGVWQKQTVRSMASPNSLSLAFAGTDPVIAHSDDLNGDGGRDAVLLARFSGVSWNSEVVASELHTSPAGQGTAYIDVSINPQSGEAEVVHGVEQHVRYVEKVGGFWVSADLGDPQAHFGASLDHDSQGRPHIALRRTDGIYHVSREGDTWSESLIRVADPAYFYDVGRGIVRIDNQDRPTVLYVKDGNGGALSGGYELELARRNF